MKINFLVTIKKLRIAINALVWSLAGLYLALTLLLHIPAVQSYIGTEVSDALGKKLGTEVQIGRVNLGMLNRIIIDDVLIKDQNHKDMLRAPRLSAKIRIRDLFQNKITISSTQLFGLKAVLYKKTAAAKPNFQFVLDSLASKDTTKHTPLNLEISSIIIRHGEISYNQLDNYNRGLFSPEHINIKNISSHIILNKLTDDSLNLNVKKISLKDKSGLELKHLSLRLVAGKHNATVSDVRLEMPGSKIYIPLLNANYKTKDKKLKPGSLSFNLKITKSILTPSDLSAFASILYKCKSPICLYADVTGTDHSVHVGNISLDQGNDLHVQASGAYVDRGDSKDWNIDIKKLTTSSIGIEKIASNFGKEKVLPKVVGTLGNISLSGKAAKRGKALNGNLKISTDIGNTTINIVKVGRSAKVDLLAENLSLQKLTANNDLGGVSGRISASGNVDGTKILTAKGNADISSFTFRNHTFNDIHASADYVKDKNILANITVNDNGGDINLNGNCDLSTNVRKGNIHGKVENLNPASLGLTKEWHGNALDFELNCDFAGLSKTVTFMSDFASIKAEGDFDYTTLVNSITNAVSDRLPTLPGLARRTATNNRFSIYGTLNKSDWLKELSGIDLQIFEPAHLIADIDDSRKKVNIIVDASDFAFNGKEYKDGYIHLYCPNDTMKALVNAKTVNAKGGSTTYNLKAQAVDNHLQTQMKFIIAGDQTIKGNVNADANFYSGERDMPTADVNIQHSSVLFGDSIWYVDPSHIKYYANNLEIDHFTIHHGDQHIIIDGKATKNPWDEIAVNLKDINVSYVMGLINFHSVEFAGYATGTVKASSLFTKPVASAHLNVREFTFEHGLMGNLDVAANWNLEDGAINIDGNVTDDHDASMSIKGYVSPKHNNIDLDLRPNGVSLAFLSTYSHDFARDLDLRGYGQVEVVGPLKAIQLVGKAKVDGSLVVSSLNTKYELRGDSVWLQPDDIMFAGDSIYDRDGHLGIASGHLRHRHLGHFTYELDIDANNLLAYDTQTFGEGTFYGTAFVTGKCSIRGKSGEVVIDIDATPEKGTQFVYNVASPDQLTNREFITWHDRRAKPHTSADQQGDDAKKAPSGMGSNLYLNFLVHANTNAEVKLLMDKNSGDYIQLFGDGVIRASFYNKGGFDMFGNYTVDHGLYKLTIQNVIKRDFDFLQGGTITFGGDAYNAVLNLKAQYTVNGVSLSDLNLGSSFSSNTIRVNCLMDITGTPSQPRVDFSLDMPTVGTDAKQAIMSLMNSEEEVKQQVVYLLAIGRFLNQGNNNSSTVTAQGQTQTSLAMQSILSGTISQQLSSILSNVVKTNDWNFGANISTGDEGLYNAQYEGLVSGRLFNNRLLINGQFGYRNNQTTNSTFIGDFDVRYLLKPSGSMAIKVYNQTNDKYFTKNSLNTQGIGLIFKKDFNGWRDFFRFRKRKKQ